MKRVILVGFIGLFWSATMVAQTVKTGILVVGNGNSALGAGIQAAKSGVNTVILMTEPGFKISPDQIITSGLQREFLSVLSAKNPNQSQQLNGNDLLKLWTDSIKNLTIIKAGIWTKFKRSGSGWGVELKDGKTIKAKVLVDADLSGKLTEALQFPSQSAFWQPLDYTTNVYRTSIAAGRGANPEILSLYKFLNPLQDNLVSLDPKDQRFVIGQAAGATAAYAAFFDRKTSQSNLKNIQGELVNFKLSLIPFEDVIELDSNWKAVQFVGLSGILKADVKEGKAFFNPEAKVSALEIKQPFKDFFYKAQIWFDDHKEEQISIGSALDLICYTGGKKLETTKAEVIKNWKKLYKFNSDFDEKRIITRREFSVLLHSYNNPFNVNVDVTGRVSR
ncbi:MAG: hypothetical protein V4687_12980 [Bacteroidota bacterium]